MLMHCYSHIHLQIYVEIERARLTRQLARMKEEEGNVIEAAEILQEVAVVCTTYSSEQQCMHCSAQAILVYKR